MRSIKVGLLALLALVVCVQPGSAQVPAGTACTEKRIRKPWEAYTAAEKTRYMNALRLAMTRGFHQKFVELHTDTVSEAEAHRNCMFIYWHRMYLLGYENMLRSLGKDYECVTIPYWDHLTATARAASGSCSSMESCSPLFQDFGGSTIGKDINMVVYRTTIRDTTSTKCVTEGPLASFCGNNTGCAGCVLRGPVSRTRYPTEATFGSVYQQMFTYSDWARFAESIERGIHNMVHSALGGIMSYFQSPIDPVFYTHHAIIDLLQTVYLKCQLGNETALLTTAQKGSDPRIWSSCPRRTIGTFRNTDNIIMRTRDYNRNWVHVRTNRNNILYPFFKDLPARYVDYVDAKDLGVYSYTYQLQGALTNMYTNCKSSNTIRAAVLMADDEMSARNSTSFDGLLPTINGASVADNKMRLWTIAVYEAAKLTGYTDEAARDQMEMILCHHSEECLGGVSDYDATFRANFGVTGHPRCRTLLQQIDKGKRIIGVPEWHDISSKFLPCPVPKREANGQLHHHHADDTYAHAEDENEKADNNASYSKKAGKNKKGAKNKNKNKKDDKNKNKKDKKDKKKQAGAYTTDLNAAATS